jgi:hypothetical protein
MTTLLQTRVEQKVAVNFKRAARQRGKSPYAYLQQIVAEAAKAPEPRTWDNHWEWLDSLNMKKLPYNAVVKMREESDER